MPIEIVDGQEVLNPPYTLSEMIDFDIKYSDPANFKKLHELFKIFQEGLKKRKEELDEKSSNPTSNPST